MVVVKDSMKLSAPFLYFALAGGRQRANVTNVREQSASRITTLVLNNRMIRYLQYFINKPDVITCCSCTRHLAY